MCLTPPPAGSPVFLPAPLTQTRVPSAHRGEFTIAAYPTFPLQSPALALQDLPPPSPAPSPASPRLGVLATHTPLLLLKRAEPAPVKGLHTSHFLDL